MILLRLLIHGLVRDMFITLRPLSFSSIIVQEVLSMVQYDTLIVFPTLVLCPALPLLLPLPLNQLIQIPYRQTNNLRSLLRVLQAPQRLPMPLPPPQRAVDPQMEEDPLRAGAQPEHGPRDVPEPA